MNPGVRSDQIELSRYWKASLAVKGTTIAKVASTAGFWLCAAGSRLDRAMNAALVSPA
jgi:hypothetical protein